MKDMDDILDELGDKWGTLSKSTQVALAQTVAGTRQYTQLVSLMDNWDYFKENLGVANSSTGALQEQADIYAQSWEAAQNRVQAAAEAIYTDLVNDEFFIDLLNGVEKALEGVKGLMEGFGGMKGILTTVSGIFMTMFANKMPDVLNNLKQNIMVLTGQAEKVTLQVQSSMQSMMDSMVSKTGGSDIVLTSQLDNLSRINAMKQRLVKASNQLTEQERLEEQMRIDLVQSMGDQIVAQAKLAAEQEKETKVTAAEASTVGIGSIQQKMTEFEALDQKLSELQAREEQATSPNTSWDFFHNWQNELADTQQKVIETDAEMTKMINALNSQTSNGAFTAEDFKTADPEKMRQANEIVQNSINTYNGYQKKLAAVQAVVNSLNTSTENFKKTSAELTSGDIKNQSKGFAELKTNMGSVLKTTVELNKTQELDILDDKLLSDITAFLQKLQLVDDDTSAEELTAQFDELQSRIGEAGKKLDTSLTKQSDDLSSVLSNMGVDMNAVSAAASKAGMSLKDYITSMFNANGASEQFKGHQVTLSETFGKMAGVAMSTVSAINSIKNAVNTWNDPDASGWEKFGATISAIIPVLSAFNGVQALNTMLTKADGIAHVTAAAGAKLHQIAELGVAGAIKEMTASLLASPLLPFIAIILGVVAALALLSAITKGIANNYNADAIAAENAATAANNLADAYGNVKQEYEDMIAAIENYQSARDALDELTKGTEEYKEALKEANRQAMDLINQYGLIEDQDYEWQGDELVIKDEAMSRVKSAKEDEVDKAYTASQMASAEAKRTQGIADQTSLKRQIRDDNGVGDGDQWWKGALDVAAGLAFDAAGGMGMGTTVAMAGIANRAEKASIYDATIDKAIEEAMSNPNLFTGTKDTMAAALDLNDQELIDALWANKDSIQELSADMNAAAQAEKLAAQNAANEIMSGSGYENTKSGQMALEAGGEIYQQLYGDAYDDYLKNAKDRSWFGTTHTGTSEQAFEDYAKEAGLSSLKGFKSTNYTKNGVEYEYIDENGDKQTKTVTNEEIAATLAAAEAAKSLEGALSELRTKLAELSNSTDLADHALADFLSEGNMDNSTKAEFEKLQTDMGYSKDENGNVSYTKEAVDAALGLTGDAAADLELAKKRRYESVEAYRQAFIDSLDIEWDVPEGLESLETAMTVGASNAIRSTYKSLGEEGGQAYIDALNQITSGVDWDALDSEQQQEMLNQLANIDWTSWDAGDQAIAIAKEYGVAIDKTSDSWKKCIAEIRDAANAVPDLEKMAAVFAEIEEITKDIDIGSILTKEDYETLVAYNEELSKYFAILSDDSAQFIGDKLDFAQDLKQQKQEELQTAMISTQDRIQELKDQQAAGEKIVGNNLDTYRVSQSDGESWTYNESNVRKQLAFLESQGYDSDKIAEWREDASDNHISVENLDAIATAVNEIGDAYGNLGSKIESLQGQVQQTMNKIALSAESAEERAQLLAEGTINEEAYGLAAMAAHNAEKWDGFETDEVDDYAKSLKTAAKSSALLSDELENNQEAAEDVALYTKKMNRGIQSLADDFEEWSDILKKSDKSSEEYADAMTSVKDAMSDVLGVQDEFLSDQFILDNMEDIALAAKGDADAIDRLAIAAGRDILVNLKLEDEGVRDEILALHDELAAEIPDIKVGATLDDGDFLSKAAQIVEEAGMSVDEANAYFRSLGFEPNFETIEAPVTSKQPIVETLTEDAGTEYVTYSQVNLDGTTSTTSAPMIKTRQTSRTVGYTTSTEMMEVPALTTDGSTPNFTLTRTNSGAMNNSSSSNSGGKKFGGGGSKSKKVDLTKKTDVVDRYKEINDAIEDNSQAMDKASKAADRLYGEARLKKMREVNNLIQEEISLNKQKREEALKYLSTDKADLQDAAKAAGVSFTFDEDGDITNYTEQMTKLWEELHAAEVAANADGNADEDEQEAIQKIQDKIDAVSEAISQYEETKSLIEDLDDEIQEQIYEWQDNNLELLQYEIELKIEINDEELEWLEYLLKKVEGDVYKVAEVWDIINQKQNITTENLETYTQGLEDTFKKATEINPETGLYDLSQSGAIEELKELRSNIINELSTLLDLDADAMAYYGDALGMVSEEIEKYTSRFDDLNTTLDHYNTLLELTGQSKNYKAMDKILSAQADVAKNQAAIAKRQYETYANEVNDWKVKMEAAQAAGDKAASELYKKNYEAAYENMVAAQDDMYSKTEEWLEDMKALYENKLADLGEQLEKALTGGISFDELTTAMERSSSLQEEYLTTTNQIYETNKLMRQAQQEIDKTTNSVAKKKLAAYIQETEQLQNQSKLSNYELEIQQAKYDLLLAEIALEEAQQAKSTVRLQRDSEGNLGYVYTADADKIADAEQELADKQNALYNIGLEGANDYAEKYSQTMQEMYETLSELHQQYLDGEFASEEEYNNAVAAAKEYYYQKLEDYSSLYKVALTTDSRVIKDAWSSDYNDMIYKVDELKDSVENYLSKSKEVISSWSQDVKWAVEESGLGDIEQAVKNVTDASKELNDYLTGEDGLLDTMDKEIKAANDATTAYGLKREALLNLAKGYEEVIDKANKYIETIEGVNDAAEQKKTDLNTDTGTTDSGSNDTASEKTLSIGSTVKVKTTAKKFASGQYMASFVPGGTYAVMNLNGEKVLIGKGGTATGWVYKSDLEGFDTGGYTGEWGSYGKLAMLHQKELVLNAGDTENFLASMEVLDHILEVIDLQSTSSRLGGLLTSPTIGGNDSVIEQHIEIHAEFPDATSHSEIEEAFNNLINQASQYANRK